MTRRHRRLCAVLVGSAAASALFGLWTASAAAETTPVDAGAAPDRGSAQPTGPAPRRAPLQASAPAASTPIPPLQSDRTDGGVVAEVIVTAQKRAQSINSVGESITAASGQQLLERGITDTAQLTKLVPGFNFTETSYATPVYTIRGIGFQESSLAASPAVSVYVDEVPLPFPVETESATLDLERVEVLKGPQGTLYGENSTGGAVNYIAAKPTRTFQAGVDASYGRFDTTDIQGFLSGPVTDKLSARLAVRAVESGNYQQSYTSKDTLGARNQLESRLLLDWHPIDRLTVAINLSASQDRSDTPAPQLIGVHPLGQAPDPPQVYAYPLAPNNDRAAGFDPNVRYRRDNIFYQASGRLNYKLDDGLTLSSITSYQRYTQNQPIEGDGTPYEVLRFIDEGSISTVFQELRLAGEFGARANWILGVNYESDDVYDSERAMYPDGSSNGLFGQVFTDAVGVTQQNVKTYAAYGNVDYNLTDTVSLQGGVRFTQADRTFAGCTQDAGDGQFALISEILQSVFNPRAAPTRIAPGGCASLGPDARPQLTLNKLDQNNVSWRVGVNWKPSHGTLLYANVSRGYKAGSFPTLTATESTQYNPVTQESILAYEAGFKLQLLERTLQLNGAGFYYDYSNKQIRGRVLDAAFGNLESLVNIPQSHVDGFELSGVWTPVRSLTITPAVTLVDSRIDGHFSNFTPLGVYGAFTGEAFPYTPRWQSNLDVQYTWSLTEAIGGFVGGNATYQGATNGGFGNISLYNVKAYTLLDIRAGAEAKSGVWRFQAYAHNATDQYYYTSAQHFADTDIRYAGFPLTYGIQLTYRYR